MNKQLFINQCKQIGRWLWIGKFHILNGIVTVITLLYLVRIVNFYPNIIGALFSIAGLFIILYLQTTDARKFAQHKPNTLGNWIKSFPVRRSVTINVNSAGIASSGGNAHIVITPGVNKTLEDKVEFVLARVIEIQKNLNKLDDRIKDVDAFHKKETTSIRSDIENVNKSISEVIAGHIVGDYDKNLFGIIITICGTLIQVFRG